VTVIPKLLRSLSRLLSRIRSTWYLRRFLWLEKAGHKQLVVGKRVRFNVPVRGEGKGSLHIGNGSSLGCGYAPRLGKGEVFLQARHPNAKIVMGESNAVGNNVAMVANEQITIGDNCLIGELVTIYDCDFHEINPATRNRSVGLTKPVSIGNNVWLGSRVLVLKGVTIGDNSVIAAASVVTKSIPANCLAAGNPAKIIRLIS
jgi:maltose O-acetyltransferase